MTDQEKMEEFEKWWKSLWETIPCISSGDAGELHLFLNNYNNKRLGWVSFLAGMAVKEKENEELKKARDYLIHEANQNFTGEPIIDIMNFNSDCPLEDVIILPASGGYPVPEDEIEKIIIVKKKGV